MGLFHDLHRVHVSRALLVNNLDLHNTDGEDDEHHV
ncbi:hypothetical protein GBAR_LOCUS15302 [Geodia barretti]|uniref:Uncharacterized protein n=1 Tax=Geodia barretti TaxID=519541 RepID=A0AA35SAU3_GEOBA|nr:hypothetical protein GBAR_LOCUS15302 [Geodia barretti]